MKSELRIRADFSEVISEWKLRELAKDRVVGRVFEIETIM